MYDLIFSASKIINRRHHLIIKIVVQNSVGHILRLKTKNALTNTKNPQSAKYHKV
jgi:hypothetical protein